MKQFTPLGVPLLLFASALSGNARGAADSPGGIEFFEKRIRPLLVENCYNCHSANTNTKGGLRVDDLHGLLAGGNTAAAIVPGQPDKSLLLKAVSYSDAGLKMPPKKQLSPEQVADLTKWIKDGAAWPKSEVKFTPGAPNPKYEKLRAEHWAWQPLRAVKPPEVRGSTWPRDDIDRFVLATLQQKGLKPVGDADKASLLRRVTFDLTGLPPTPQQIAAFEADGSANAFEKVVDRLLASSAYGERWGRHWLDVARYAESTGSSRNIPYPHAWRYRDYVIDSFNKDKPYDQFIREQIAGQLLPAKNQAQSDELRIATGFLALGVKDVNQRFKVRFEMDNVDEQIDTVSRSVLGLTASCARCHDHKFDPITQSDYYAVAGIFTSTDLCGGVRSKMGGNGVDYYDPSKLLRLGPDGPPNPKRDLRIEELEGEVKAAREKFQALRQSPEGQKKGPDGKPKRAAARQRMVKLQNELMALQADGREAVFGVREGKVIDDTALRIRGEAEQLGPVIPRGFLSLIQFPQQPKVNPQQSGRLELAQWLTDARNPLTARVMVNRIWHHLFGKGIVSSVDNFGVTGDVPSHPELLDHLANRFIKEKWSVKKLVREIVLTRTYRLSSDTSAANAAIDPAADFLWRHNPRRLEAEEIRDATLAASGNLKTDRPDGSPAKALPMIEQRNNGPEAARFATIARDSVHRSIYLPLLRGWTPTALEIFDFAEQGMVTGDRDETTVSPQALYMLNDPFVRKQSQALAERLRSETGIDDGARIKLAYRLAVGRAATSQEIAQALAYLADFEARFKEIRAIADSAPKAAAPVQLAAASKGGGLPTPDSDADTPQQVIDPDQIVYVDETASVEQFTGPADPKTAAWASFCQALIGSAEFQYLR